MKAYLSKRMPSFYFLQFGKFDVIYFFRKNKKRLLADFCPILHELYPLFY